MDVGRRVTFVALLVVAVASGVPMHGAQTAKSAQAEALPPISYTCPMHPDVVEDKKGLCPICKMELVPIRLDTIWSCPVHAAVHESKPGKCPIDGRELIQVTVAVSWTCPGTDIKALTPGTCADGSPMTRKYEARPHGNHNPQHGGQFFMASDNWHHLEGTYQPSGVFRLHLYDDYTKPLTAAQMRGISATLVAKDSRTGQEKTISLVRSGRTLQATVGKLPLPAAMYAKVRFKADAPENRFDFTFETYSKEPASGASPAVTTAATLPTPKPSATGATAAPADPVSTALSPGVDPALVPLPIPETVPEMLAQLRTRTEQIRAIIDKGSFAAVYVPAFQAKDLALALDAHTQELPPDRRKIAEPAIGKLVRSAWLLDAFGDIGNKQQITEAYDKFVAAAKDIQAAFPPQP